MVRSVSDLGSLLNLWRAGRARRRHRSVSNANHRSSTLPDRLVSVRVRELGGDPVFLRVGSTDHPVFWETFIERFYELPAQLRLDPVRCIVDLGCYTGLSALAFAARAPSAHVVGLDASEQNLRIARRNIAAGHFAGRITLLHGAIWSSDGFVRFDESVSEGQWAYQVTENPQGSPVPAYRLTTLLNELRVPHVDLLKVNIEGAERQLLADAPAWAPQVSTVLSTFHDDDGFDRFKSRLSPLGFQCYPPRCFAGQQVAVAARKAGV